LQVGGVVIDERDKKKGSGGRVGNLEMFKTIVKSLKVLARSTPDDKYTLVTGLIQLGNVVAVTGDGTNDAPALKKADVGFAMGIAGTEVAKEAAGIILLDDNFKSIVTACKWGRNIYDSIRKFIQFQLTINIVALFMAFIGSVVVSASPLNSIQMLWVNLIMDTFAALALATEPPSEEVLNRMPYSRKEYIVTPMMWRNIIGQSIYQISIFSVMLFAGPRIFDVPDSSEMIEWQPEKGVHFTMIFHAFVFAQLTNEFNCRKLMRNENIFKGFFNNPLFFIIEIGTIIVQVALVQFGGAFIKCAPLTFNQHMYCVAIGLGSIFMGFIIRALPDAMFDSITLLKEKNLSLAQMDRSLVSSLRKRSTVRLHSTVN
jgi:Ca2+ transporting ATPase